MPSFPLDGDHRTSLSRHPRDQKGLLGPTISLAVLGIRVTVDGHGAGATNSDGRLWLRGDGPAENVEQSLLATEHCLELSPFRDDLLRTLDPSAAMSPACESPGALAVGADQGQKVTESALVRLNPAPTASRYQAWKFTVWLATMELPGARLPWSRVSRLIPRESD